MKTFEEVLQEGKHTPPDTWDNRDLIYDRIESSIKEYIHLCGSLAKEKGERGGFGLLKSSSQELERKIQNLIYDYTDNLSKEMFSDY